MSVLIYGLISSITLALMAIGLSFTFGVSGIANFAYGGLYIFSAYITWQLLNAAGLPYFVDIVIDYQRLIVVIIGLGLVAFIYFFTRYTKLGRSFRAIAQNERTALSFG